MASNYAGGFKVFGPTYNSTKYVRFGHEGEVNSMHAIDPALVPDDTANNTLNGTAVPTLAGKIAAINGAGEVTLCANAYKGELDSLTPVGLFVDDIGDIVGASNKATFYFRGGEYYVSVARMKAEEDFSEVAGKPLYVDATTGCLTATVNGDPVAIATTNAEMFTTGNMYENAGEAANGGLFVGISLKI